jgi:hypothetical protein
MAFQINFRNTKVVIYTESKRVVSYLKRFFYYYYTSSLEGGQRRVTLILIELKIRYIALN